MRDSIFSLTACALLSGVMVGLAFPPTDFQWLAWIALVPLLWAMQSGRNTFLLGALTGLAACLLLLHPLVSAYAWSGWSQDSGANFAERMRQQQWFLHALWLGASVFGACFWGLWATLSARLVRGRLELLALVAPALWVVLEYARGLIVFDYTWGFLGNTAVDWTSVRQLASLGGVSLLGFLVVLTNVGALALLQQRWRVAIAVAGIVASSWGVGLWLLAQPIDPSHALRAMTLQYTRERYSLDDFSELGMDKAYVPMLRLALNRHPDLIVLPESVAIGAIQLDRTNSSTKQAQVPASRWTAEVAAWRGEQAATIIAGVDTVQDGRDHNSLLAWSQAGLVGWYHKRRRVPFAEYQPFNGWTAERGEQQYAAGDGAQLIFTDAGVLGPFICQEVLIPDVVRETVRAGAKLLVSGGNDGVFADSAVAVVNAHAAQLRAVEAGRYLVRAMKTGVSAIIDAKGNVLVHGGSAPGMLQETVFLLDGQTLYARFGNWVVGLSLLLVLTVLGLRRRC